MAKTAVTFTNYSDAPFTCTWDGAEYNFAPGQSTLIEAGIADVFAKHLAERELNARNISLIPTAPAFIAEKMKALNGPSVTAENESKLEHEIMNQPKKKAVKKKKEVVEETFEGLE